MAVTVELLTGKTPSESAKALLDSIGPAITAAGDKLVCTNEYRGGSDFLVLFGVGAEPHDIARSKQVDAGGHALLWDLGYIGRKKITGYLRISIDTDHPQQWLDRTPSDPSRWKKHGIQLREDADPTGPILLIGMGRKSILQLNAQDWERAKLQEIKRRFPGRLVIRRPKSRDEKTPIEQLLRGASLVVCRHSNVAVDAAIAGVPFEAEDGAAIWLLKREFTRENRLDFLQRLSWWQWKCSEAAQAWAFAKRVVCA